MADMNEDSSYVFDFTNYGGKTSKGEELLYKGETPKGGTITLKGTGEVLVNDITDGTYYATKDTDESTVTVNEDESTLTRDELTERLIELEKRLEVLEKTCSDTSSIDGISTIVSGLQEESKNHATKTELEAVSSVANANKEAISSLASTEDLENVSTILQETKKVAENAVTDSELNAVATVANAALSKTDASNTYLKKTDASNTYATKASVTTINNSLSNYATVATVNNLSTIVNANKTAIASLASAEDLENINTILQETKKVAENAVTDSELNAVATVANAALSKTDASNTYLKKTDASNTYATKASVTTISNSLSNYATVATVNNLSTIVNANKTAIASLASTEDLENINTILQETKKVAENAVTDSELNAVATVANSKTTKTEALDAAYPVGSIYVSTSLTTVDQVKVKLGGTWEVYGQGRVLVGKGSNGTTTYTAGATGGSESISTKLTEANLPSHTHSFTPTGTIKSTFTGTAVTSGSTGSGYTIGHTYATRTTSSTGNHRHGIYVQKDLAKAAMGSAYNRIGNSSDGDTNTWATGSDYAGTHTHTYPDYYANSISGVQAHTHSVTAAGTVGSTFTGTAGTTGAKGSGTAFSTSTLQPYVVVYMYRRTN